MPQMAPINWLTLYIFFMMIFLIFIILNYYSFNYIPKITKMKKNNIKLNWKW
uniref:ATP synthase complex subunit 8 n=1 Tax=Entiminae sp. ACP-2013 TaxID=2480628 RepID=A0A3G5FP19_9CUCU|nr:ATP synthase F0 subunit 8 [Entiminae sp. ACP-2013]